MFGLPWFMIRRSIYFSVYCETPVSIHTLKQTNKRILKWLRKSPVIFNYSKSWSMIDVYSECIIILCILLVVISPRKWMIFRILVAPLVIYQTRLKKISNCWQRQKSNCCRKPWITNVNIQPRSKRTSFLISNHITTSLIGFHVYKLRISGKLFPAEKSKLCSRYADQYSMKCKRKCKCSTLSQILLRKQNWIKRFNKKNIQID